VNANGVIVFHDFHIVYRAIFDSLDTLGDRNCLAYLVEGDVFAIFLDPVLVYEDEYLHRRYREHRHDHLWLAAKQTISPFMPKPIKGIYRKVRATLHKARADVT
jgi:hypothetical protein